MTKTISIAALNVSTAGEKAHEFEYISPDGTGSGVFLSVLGGESATVQAVVNKMVNDRRKQQTKAASSRGGQEFVPIESDIEFGQKLTAVRLVGWRGITEDYSPELALELVKGNARLAEQVTSESNEAINFLPSKSKA
jgi:hypothetical protein